MVAVERKEMYKSLPWHEEIAIHLTGIVGVGPLLQVRRLEILRHGNKVIISLRQIQYLIVYQFEIENTILDYVALISLYILSALIKCSVCLKHIFFNIYLTVCVRSIIIDSFFIIWFIRNGSVFVSVRYPENLVIECLRCVTKCHHILKLFNFHIGRDFQILIFTHAASLLHLHLARTGIEHNLVYTEVSTIGILRIVVYLHREVRKVSDINVLGYVAMTIHLIPFIIFIAVVAHVHGVEHTRKERHDVCPVAKLVLGIYVRHQLRAGLATFCHIGDSCREVYL